MSHSFKIPCPFLPFRETSKGEIAPETGDGGKGQMLGHGGSLAQTRRVCYDAPWHFQSEFGRRNSGVIDGAR